MNNPLSSNLLENLLAERGIKSDSSNKYEKLGLSSNPFPKSGISDISGGNYLFESMPPIDDKVKDGIHEFVIDSLNIQGKLDKEYISGVIRGNYGVGKTQTLMYAKHILELFNERPEYNRKPYVIYIDNPGERLTELIGSIISQIGEENFKRYLWNIAFGRISDNGVFCATLDKFKPSGMSLFADEIDPFNPVNTVSYKHFLDAWYSKILNANLKKKKEFQDLLKEFILRSFVDHFKDGVIGTYFYNVLTESIGVNKTWEALTSGSAKDLDKKEVYIIRAIVNLLEDQGYTNFYILVDEFENVTVGRLSLAEVDRYSKNLRTLIDKERNWCSLFAMTSQALKKLTSVSPPLAARISGRLIDIGELDNITSKKLVLNYLNMSREEDQSIFPFDESALELITKKSSGILRTFLKGCFILIQI